MFPFFFFPFFVFRFIPAWPGNFRGPKVARPMWVLRPNALGAMRKCETARVSSVRLRPCSVFPAWPGNFRGPKVARPMWALRPLPWQLACAESCQACGGAALCCFPGFLFFARFHTFSASSSHTASCSFAQGHHKMSTTNIVMNRMTNTNKKGS